MSDIDNTDNNKNSTSILGPAADSHEDYYSRLNDECGRVISSTFKNDESQLQATAHSYVNDFGLWISILGNRTERSVLERAMREYQFGLLAVAQGTYRHAFMALRLSFELTLNGIYLSAYEHDLREWLLGERESGMRSLLDQSDGLFSTSFGRAFNPELEDHLAHYRSLADDVYSECSDYAHGKLTSERSLPESIEFSTDTFEKWHDRADTVRLVCFFTLCLRYLKDLQSEQMRKVETATLDTVGHIPEIRAQFERNISG